MHCSVLNFLGFINKIEKVKKLLICITTHLFGLDGHSILEIELKFNII
jgi:hypothetical protein